MGIWKSESEFRHVEYVGGMAAEVHRRDEEVNLPNEISPSPYPHNLAERDIKTAIVLSPSRQKTLLRRSSPYFSEISKNVKRLDDALSIWYKTKWSLAERRERARQAAVDIREATQAMREFLKKGKGVPFAAGTPQKMLERNIYPLSETESKMLLIPDHRNMISSVYCWLGQLKSCISPVHRVDIGSRFAHRNVLHRTHYAHTALLNMDEAVSNIEAVMQTNPDYAEPDIDQYSRYDWLTLGAYE